jgi:formate dehydrogenase accessory protein FdhD
MKAEDIPALPLEAVQRAGLSWNAGATRDVDEAIAAEVPIALVYNGVSHVVMLGTPLDLESFGIGFSVSEGIVRRRSEIHDVEAAPVAEGIEVRMTIASARFMELKERRRNLAGRTGCGLCGTESLRHAIRSVPVLEAGPTVECAALHRAFAALPAHQKLFERTGAVHAAGWARPDGSIVLAREDVGRHNALDKLIGSMAREGLRFDDGFAVITSRASSEMVQKASTVGMRLMAAISAPTELAIRLADQANLTLVGFARKGRHVAYSHAERLAP